MKLNNKGFAISSMLYSILLLFLMLIVGVLAILGNRKVVLDKVKNEIITSLTQNRAYRFSFVHKDILLANTSKVSDFTFDLLDGVMVIDQNGNVIETEIKTTSAPSFDSTVNGLYTITYSADYEGNIIEEQRVIEVIDPVVYEYAYTGKEQKFVTPTSGLYRTELWGAQGGNISGKAYNQDGTVRANKLTYTGGKGAYTKGDISLGIGVNLYIYVGGSPEENTSSEDSGTSVGGYNGGASIQTTSEFFGVGGGGATDIRLIGGNWDSFDGLKSRIMVASGGGGANFRNAGYGEGNGGEGGTLNGINGYEALTEGSYHRPDFANGYVIGLGATQTSGGKMEYHYLNGTTSIDTSPNGTFGGKNANPNQSGGGGGYYSGGSSGHGGAGGGSSYISGMVGCDSITENSTEGTITHTGSSDHYSGRVFTNVAMKAGNQEMPTYDDTSTMTGNEGNGYAKITALIIDNGKVATNLVKNSGFENGTKNWTLSGTELTTKVSSTGKTSLQFNPNVTAMSTQTMDIPIANHIYYGGLQFLSSNTFTTVDPRYEWFIGDAENSHMVFSYKNIKTVVWEKLTTRTSLSAPNSGNWVIRNFMLNSNEEAYADDLFIIDLTEIYGEGNEPTKEWCDANIHYFDGVGIVPKY